MPFVVIKGSFHLVGKSSQGNPTGFEPDGDSMQFKPETIPRCSTVSTVSVSRTG